ncbi:MAG: hypothetical protein KKB31_04725 [Nanoarchaeota archaeon]|nr:hypothetical protein [Nanoarchaeota archaeon]
MVVEKKRSFKNITKSILVAFAIIAFWRGVWELMDIYLFPSNKPLSALVSLIIGLVILYSTRNLLEKLT